MFVFFLTLERWEIQFTKQVHSVFLSNNRALASYKCLWYDIELFSSWTCSAVQWSDAVARMIKWQRGVVLCAVFLRRCWRRCIKTTCCPGQKGANHSRLYRLQTEGGFHSELEPLAEGTTGYLYFQALPPFYSGSQSRAHLLSSPAPQPGCFTNQARNLIRHDGWHGGREGRSKGGERRVPQEYFGVNTTKHLIIPCRLCWIYLTQLWGVNYG